MEVPWKLSWTEPGEEGEEERFRQVEGHGQRPIPEGG